MFRSSTIIRELALNLAKVIFMLKNSAKLRRYLLCCYVAACCSRFTQSLSRLTVRFHRLNNIWWKSSNHKNVQHALFSCLSQTSFLLGPNILPSTFFSFTPNLCPLKWHTKSDTIWNRPVILLHILPRTFSRRKTKELWLHRSKHYPKTFAVLPLPAPLLSPIRGFGKSTRMTKITLYTAPQI